MAINLHPGQTEIFEALFTKKTARNVVSVCSRGWGKSYFAGAAAATACFELMKLPKWVPNKNVYIIAPTYDQVTDIYYPILVYEMGLDQYCIRTPRRDLGRFQFPNNVELRLISFEAVERVRGKGAYFIVNDEMSSWTKGMTAQEAWEGILQPALITRWSEKRAKKYNAPSAGRSLTITTPKGFNFVYDMFHYPERDPLWQSFHYDYHGSPFLDPDEIERIRHTIDPIQFATEYLASFKDSGTNVFYMFDRKVHVRNDIEKPHDGEDVHISIDFNVGVMASTFWTVRGKQLQAFGETMGHPDTESLASSLKERFKGHKILAYPDPTGRSRKTSAPVGVTDLSILKSHGITVLARKKSPPIADSVQAVNGKLMNAAGDVEMFFHPDCTGSIKSMERTHWVENNPDSATIDKKEGLEHYSDGTRYITEFLFPVQHYQKRAVRGFTF